MIRILFLIIHIVINTCLSTLVLSVLGLFIPYSRTANYVFVQWSWLIVKISGIKLNIHGLENFDSSKPYVIAANHCHLYDIPILVIASKLNIRFAAKKELFKIPVFGLALKLIGMVKVDRANNKKALGELKKVEEILKKHSVSLVIFPEGTRNKKAKGLLPFKKGAFMTSINSGLELLPVTINGSNNIIKSYRVKPGTVDVYFHPPINPEKYGVKARTEFMDEAKNLIYDKLSEK